MKFDITSGKYEVVGIVSRFDEWSDQQGPSLCLGSMPSIYTRVSAFVPWIKESMTNPDSFMQHYQEKQISEEMWDCVGRAAQPTPIELLVVPWHSDDLAHEFPVAPYLN